MSRRRAAWIAAAVAGVLGLLIVAFATGPPSSSRVLDSPFPGKAAPGLDGRTIDGRSFDEASLRGRWVLVNFFATWCVPCREEHDDLARFAARYAGDDAAVVGVVYEDSVTAVRRFRDEEGGDWPMLADPGGRIAVRWGVAGVPESFLIRPDGVVASRIVGGVLYGELEKVLAQAKREARGARSAR